MTAGRGTLTITRYGAVVVTVLLSAGYARGQQADPAAAPPSPYVVLAPDDLLASNLIDLELSDADHRRLGEIEDVVLDSGHRIKALVIALGVSRNESFRHIALDWSAVKLTRDGDGKWHAETDLSREALGSAPQAIYRSGFNAD